jgi:NAD(P)H-dependent flavin oxidoreductase YrpB (nitropropane dioxygenase family)
MKFGKVEKDWHEKDGALLHTPPNHLFRIDTVWLAVSIDASGNEGVCAVSIDIGHGPMLMPLMAADKRRLQSFVLPRAKELAATIGVEIRVVKIGSAGHARETIAAFNGNTA